MHIGIKLGLSGLAGLIVGLCWPRSSTDSTSSAEASKKATPKDIDVVSNLAKKLDRIERDLVKINATIKEYAPPARLVRRRAR